MNSEIERAFVAAAAAAFAPLPVVPGLSDAINPAADSRLIVDGSADNESPVATLWKLPISFRLDFSAMVDGVDQTAELRTASRALAEWLKNKPAVVEAFESEQIQLLPNYHISASRPSFDGDRIFEEIIIIAGFREL